VKDVIAMHHRKKFYCAVHDWAAKGPCPRQHDDAMITYLVSNTWRPGKKGTKMRLWDARQRRNHYGVSSVPVLFVKEITTSGSWPVWKRLQKPSGRITSRLV
jgi:hypothetical protein